VGVDPVGQIQQVAFRCPDPPLVASTTQLRELAEHALVLGAGMTAVQQQRLSEMQGYYHFMVGRLEALLSEYTAARESRRTRP